MNENGKKLRTGAIILLSMLLSWLVLDLFSQLDFWSNKIQRGIPLMTLLNYLVPVTIVTLFLVACCAKKSKVVLIIGAGIGILWYMLPFGACLTNYRGTVRYLIADVMDSFFLMSFMILLLLAALLSKRKPTALRKILCILPALVFFCDCIRNLSDMTDEWWTYWYRYILFMEFNPRKTLLPLLPMMVDMLQFLAFTWLAGAATRDSEEMVTGSGRGLRIVGLILIGAANMLSMMIAAVSVALYNRVYYFDGYEVTAVLWTFVFMTLITGGVLLGIGMLLSHKAAVVAPQNGAAMPAQQPVYQQPIYQQPVQQPVYQQPIYQQPVYQPPVQQPAQPAIQQKDVFEQLTQLKQMLDMELISQEEYDAKKKQILDL